MVVLRRKWKPVAAIGLILVVLAYWFVPASAVHDLGLFELEGDAVEDAAVAGDDWTTVLLGTGGGAITNTGVLSDPAPKSIFTQGGSKDPQDITAWRHKAGSVPDKDDITNAYAAAYNFNNDLIVYFGADRYANDGDAQLGFWFFQQNVTLNTDGTFSGQHAVGDVLVLANFSNGGSQATIQVLEWVGSGGDQSGGTLRLLLNAENAQCGPGLGGDLACAVTNPAPVASPWSYTPKSGPANVFPPFSFFEGGINLTQVFAAVGTPIPCFTSFLAETRSSTSVTATLKDFVLGAFPVCGISITKTCNSSAPNAAQTALVYNYSGTVTNDGIATLHNVTVVDDAGTPGNTADDQTFDLGTLGAGATVTFTGSFESLQNPATNTASVSASTVPGDPPSVSDVSDPAVCPPVDLSPNIDVSKACEASLTVLDNRVVVLINFGGQVCNTGTVTLDNVRVIDDRGTPANTADDATIPVGTLTAGQCATYNGNYLPSSTNSGTPSLATFTDTVKAVGEARLRFGTVEDTRTATCPLCPPEVH
jgi:hypothetical protein